MSHTVQRDATKLGAAEMACDLVFLDPPYGKGLGQLALKAASAGGWIAPKALIVWEESAPQEPPQGFAVLDQRKYGDTYVTLITQQCSSSASP